MKLEEFDDVIVTGRITSEPGNPLVTRLRGVVATVSKEDNYIKVWPSSDLDPQLPPNTGGKLWFNLDDPETVVEVLPEP